MPTALKTLIYALLITFLFSFVSKVAYAKETIFVCGGNYYKHNYGIFKKSMEIRVDGVWVKWCKPPDEIFKITADSAVCEQPEDRTVGDRGWVSPAYKIVIDFIRKNHTRKSKYGIQKEGCYFK